MNSIGSAARTRFSGVAPAKKQVVANQSLFICSTLGLVLSIYDIYVKARVKASPSYHPIFEFGWDDSLKRLVCFAGASLVARSLSGRSLSHRVNLYPHDRALGLPVWLVGMGFYTISSAWCLLPNADESFILRQVHLGLSTLAALSSVYLAWYQTTIKNTCTFCLLMYGLNAGILYSISSICARHKDFARIMSTGEHAQHQQSQQQTR